MEFERRAFLKIVGLSSIALLFSARGATLLAAGKKLAIPLDKAEKLKVVGGWAVLKLQDTRILFVRDTETTVAALDPLCTHEKCELGYNRNKNELDCPCHKSSFTLAGKRLGGPAPKDLKTYPATLDLEKNRIVIEL